MPNPKPNLSICTQPIPKPQPKLYFPSVSIEGKSEIQNYICKDYPKELYTKFYSDDIEKIPDKQAITDRRSFGCKDGESYYLYHISNIFCENLKEANTISIIDKHLTISALQVLSNILVECKDSVVHPKPDKFFVLSALSEKDTRDLLNIEKIISKKDIRFIIFNMNDGKFIHDRFVMLDDELWHFGGTVGGFQPNLTAYSRGWYNHGFREFIDDIESYKYSDKFNEIKLG